MSDSPFTVDAPTEERKVGRPKQNRSRIESVSRPKRIPVGVPRSSLSLIGKDDAYHYRYVLDKDERGTRIQKFLQGGYEFVSWSDLALAESVKWDTEQYGSIVRMSAGKNDERYLYLMRIKREWYEEDKKEQQDHIDRVEASMNKKLTGTEQEDGMYGQNEIVARNRRPREFR